MTNAIIYFLAPILIFILLLGLSHIWKTLGLVDSKKGSKSLGCLIVLIIIVAVIVLSTMQFADGYRVYKGF